MNRRFPKAVLLLTAAAILFLVGIVRLFELRFTAGDVYPAYSTLRSDPLGTKILYASLEGLPGLRVERNLRPLRRLLKDAPQPAGEPTTAAVFYLGANVFSWPFLFTRQETERLETVLQQGGQVIISFAPTDTPMTSQRLVTVRRENQEQQEREARAARSKSPAPDKDKNKGNKPDASPSRRTMPTFMKGDPKEDLILRWKLDFRRIEPKKDTRAPQEFPGGEAISATPGAESAEPVSWHTSVDFDVSAAAATAGWRTLYLRDAQPVIVARNFGPAGGRIVLASDSYFLSNEALRGEPHPELLASLVGPSRRLIFDETHFSISENPGLMALARRFHLEWALGVLGLLAGLFIWKSMVSLVPPARAASADNDQPVAEPGRDSAVGFLNLVRRSVPPRDLLGACLAQWQAGASGSKRPTAVDAEVAGRLRAIVEAEAAKPLRRRELAGAYRTMCEVMNRRGEGGKMK